MRLLALIRTTLAPGGSHAEVPALGASIAERFGDWADALATICTVAIALGAGLAAAYGRELQAGRSPQRSWWIARILLLPLLAIGAAAASEAFNLSRIVTAFTAAMLSLGGYDCLRLIEARWRARLAELAEASGQSADTPSDGADRHEGSQGD